jgi:hypothetical protein
VDEIVPNLPVVGIQKLPRKRSANEHSSSYGEETQAKVRLREIRIDPLKNDRQTRCDAVHNGVVCTVEDEKDEDIGVSKHDKRVRELPSRRTFVNSVRAAVPSDDGDGRRVEPPGRGASISHNGAQSLGKNPTRANQRAARIRIKRNKQEECDAARSRTDTQEPENRPKQIWSMPIRRAVDFGGYLQPSP